MILERILIAIFVPLAAYTLKWIAANITVSLFRNNFLGINLIQFEKDKWFRLLGWDFASVSVGLFLAALFVKASRFSHIHASAEELSHLVTISCFVLFIWFYIIAIIVRYVFIVAAERYKDSPDSDAISLLPGLTVSPDWLCWLCALLSWGVGFLLMGYTSWLAVGVE